MQPHQSSIEGARVLLVGAGGLGSPAAIALARAGVRRFRVVDPDRVEPSNLHRQILHRTADAGRPKVESAAAAIRRIAPGADVEIIEGRFDAASAPALLAGIAVALDGSDNFPTKFLMNDACVEAGVPFVHGAAIRWEGQLLGVDPRRGDPCYRCLFEAEPPPGVACTCAEAGVCGPVVGVIGALQAEAALALLAGASHDALAQNGPRGERLGRMLVYNGVVGHVRSVRFRRNPDCAVCNRINAAASHPEVSAC